MLHRDYIEAEFHRLGRYDKSRIKPTAPSNFRGACKPRSLLSQAAMVYTQTLRKKQAVLCKAFQLSKPKPQSCHHCAVQDMIVSNPWECKIPSGDLLRSLTKRKVPRVTRLYPRRSYPPFTSPSKPFVSTKLNNKNQSKPDTVRREYNGLDTAVQPSSRTSRQKQARDDISPVQGPRLAKQPLQEQLLRTYSSPSSVTSLLSIRRGDEMDPSRYDSTECSCRSCQTNAKQKVDNDCCWIPPPRSMRTAYSSLGWFAYSRGDKDMKGDLDPSVG